MKRTNEKVYTNNGNPAVLNAVEGTGKLVLDVGCGDGANARILKKAGHTIDGITLSQQEADVVKDVIRNVYICDLEHGLPATITAKYDVIICSHVLEHIAYPAKLLAGIRNVMAPGAKMIVALPNIMHYTPRMQLLRGNFNHAETGIWDYTHMRWYTFKSAAKMFADNGFSVVKAWVDGTIPLYRVTKYLPAGVQKQIFNMLTAISKGFFGAQLLYVIQKHD